MDLKMHCDLTAKASFLQILCIDTLINKIN